MKLENFKQFLESFKPEHQSILHLAVTVQRYFYFAEIQANIFNEKISKMYDRSGEKNFSDICYSSCFAMYAHIRTCLEANKRLGDELQSLGPHTELQEFRSQNFAQIQSIVNIANNIVKHPLDKDGKVLFYEPGGFNNAGEVTVYEWSSTDDDYFELPKIHPIKDLQTIHSYLEKVSAFYLQVIS